MKIKCPRLHVSRPESTFAEGSTRWTNLDLDPVPHHQRNWGVMSFIGTPIHCHARQRLILSDIAYWISDAFNVSTWQFASSMLAVGLSVSDALIIVAISFLIISVVIAANGAVGATYHIPFPVIARASWGFWGSYVAIVSRLILALFWFAIHNVNGGNAVKVMIGAIWPSFLDIENRIPEGQGITTSGMVGYVVYWALQFPLLCIRPDRVRWVFLVKSVLVPVAWVAMLVWAFVAEGGGDLFEEKGSKVRGSRYSWLFLANMTSVLGNYATTSVNQVCRLPWPMSIHEYIC